MHTYLGYHNLKEKGGNCEKPTFIYFMFVQTASKRWAPNQEMEFVQTKNNIILFLKPIHHIHGCHR